MRISLILFFIFYAFTSWAQTPIAINNLWQNDIFFEEILIPEKETKIAAFERNGYAYVVLSDKNNFTVLPKNDWRIIPHPSVLILRTPLNNRQIHIEKVKDNLQILLGQKQKNTFPSIFDLKQKNNGILIELSQTKPISFLDPNTLENITALPVSYSPIFINEEYRNPEIIFPPTILGIVIISKTENINLKSDVNGYLWSPVNKSSLSIHKKNNHFTFYQKMPIKSWKEQINHIHAFIPFSDTKLKEQLHTELAFLYLSKGFTSKAQEIADLLQSKKISSMIDYYSNLKEKTPSNTYAKQRFYFQKAQELETEDFQQAKDFYQKAYDIKPVSVFAAKSLAALTYIGINEGTIDSKTAISTLEKLRCLLGEKDQKILLFKTLSELYEKEGITLKALDNKRELLSLTKDKKLAHEMEKEFEKFFDHKSKQKPEDRILAYYRFPELMPVGARGFDIKKQLINDYIDLDLLQQAYELSMQTAAELNGILAQRAYIKAGLIAELMQDKTQSKKAFDLSNFKQMKDFSFIVYFHPLLQNEWLKVKP